jgi:hypothetical protein
MRAKLKHPVLAVSLVGVLLTALSACTPHHDHFHNKFGLMHEQFHGETHPWAEHHQFLQGWEELPRDYRGRGSYSRRYDDRDPYYGSILRW